MVSREVSSINVGKRVFHLELGSNFSIVVGIRNSFSFDSGLMEDIVAN